MGSPTKTFIALLLLATSAMAAERPKLLVTDLGTAGGIAPDIGAAFSEAIGQEIARRGFFDTIAAAEIRALLGVERQKTLLGCNEGDSCQAEIAGSLGAKFALSGTIAKLGDSYQLTLQMLDTQKAQPIARATRIANSLEALRASLPWAVAEATGTPLPAQPSKLLPYSLMAGGALAVATGAVIGISATTQANIAQQELLEGETAPGPIHSLSYYEQQDRSLRVQKTVSLVAMVAGAAMLGTGIVLYRGDSTSTTVALVPQASGAALAGVFP